MFLLVPAHPGSPGQRVVTVVVGPTVVISTCNVMRMERSGWLHCYLLLYAICRHHTNDSCAVTRCIIGACCMAPEHSRLVVSDNHQVAVHSHNTIHTHINSTRLTTVVLHRHYYA